MNFENFLRGPLMDGEPDANSGGGAPGTPAPAQTLTMDQVNEIVNRAVANVRREFSKKNDPAPAVKAPEAAQPEGGDSKLADKAFARQIEEMGRQMQELRAENERTKREAEAKDLDSTVRSEISKYDFAKPGASEDLFKVLRGAVKRTDEGIFSEDGFSLSEYVKKSYDDRPWLAPAKSIGGSGAQSGRGSGKGIDIESIKPGMSQDQRNAAYAEVRRALGLNQ